MQNMLFHQEPATVYDQKQHLLRHLMHKVLKSHAIEIIMTNASKASAQNEVMAKPNCSFFFPFLPRAIQAQRMKPCLTCILYILVPQVHVHFHVMFY
jgi:hypothetical protein